MSGRSISSRDLARLLGDWRPGPAPAYVALSGGVRLLVLDGRLPVGVRLPAERELAAALGSSRTTIGAAYDALRSSGHAASRRGSGTWTTVPDSGTDVPAWAPEPAPDGVLDLAHAAPSAPPAVHVAYAAALDELPRYLPGTGYDYRGLPLLRARVAERFTARGLPTSPDQVLITNGAVQGIRLCLALAAGAGDRVLVEQPGYPNGLDAVTDLGGRPVPVPVDLDRGWDDVGLAAALRQTAPRAAYLVPDFQNPSGALMDGEARQRTARMLDRHRTVAVIDETLVELALDPHPAVAPFATQARSTPVLTVGSASKIAWGGLRVGWVRADRALISRLAAQRSRQDIAGPVLEQLACAHLLADLEGLRTHRIGELRTRRALLLGLLAQHLPDWVCPAPPGGQVLWCTLPAPASAALVTAAADLGVRITAGSRFAVDGTLQSRLRLPFTPPAEVLERAVPLLASAWSRVAESGGSGGSDVAADSWVV